MDWWRLVLYVLFVIFASLNLYVAIRFDSKEMRKRYIDGQCIVGGIFANVFYLPAWTLKGVRFALVYLIK